ncbi:YbgA family protein [Pseudobacteriovorax antillogorgiicola]|uniref:Uncharacterized conserved protein YbbK, DUF523 family n=1 Tax=Pseudobacteriovorax antillogorgiicola TaxID=1513793 RepID=A0A1Y6CEX8_9BACT|nr:DUF523 and DUF1722 domain-containing protein [Pseudobacteriovorax antillogorgiicola]TCS49044.1 uncharacterized protein YbbK (DUF523 family) [Pseudobacteriovorax antillogorgiicola]SMF52615.1 Uncharacterized conserved protein YbbK, DUF523 family [Pseudobacteriovorax antillogorgiicola]
MESYARPKVAISACLLGKEVRYDGTGKKNRWIDTVLRDYVDFKPLCPEMAMGLGTPRETMRVVKDSQAKTLHLVTSKTRQDMTELAKTTVRELLDRDCADVDAFILMANSPMCGLKFVKVYESKNDIPHKDGSGFFAAALRERFPHVPIIEGPRLDDLGQREAFLSHLYMYHSLGAMEASPRALQEFHRAHKFLLLSYSPKLYRQMGPLVAQTSRSNIRESIQGYRKFMAQVFSGTRQTKHGSDALLHIYGFLKEGLRDDEKRYVLESIEQYRKGLYPISLPLKMLSLLNIRQENSYLHKQKIFSPFPLTLQA